MTMTGRQKRRAPIAASAADTQVVLQEALQCLLQDGASACASYLQRRFPRLSSAPQAQLDVMLTLARRAQTRFPQAALDLLEQAAHVPARQDAVLTFKATLLDKLGRQDEARQAAATVVHDPNAHPEQRLQAANMLVRLHDDAAAADVARAAFAQLGQPLSRASALLYIALKVADWPLVAQLVAQLRQAIADGRQAEAAEGPRTHVLWCASEKDNIDVLQHWATRYAATRALDPVASLPPAEGRRLRIGYLSSDFREHPTSRLINGLLRHHDRSQFELFMYCSGWDDGSPMRREIESHFEHIYSITGLSDEQAAQRIRSHRIDVLVELNGPTRAHRLGVLAYRPAPVQIGYLGWPGSYGGAFVDYIVADPYVIPQAHEALYPEKLIRLSHTYQINDYAARPPLAAVSRQQCGLPDGEAPILGMFNAINKVRGDVWAVWMKILQQVPQATLWILDPGRTARSNLAKATRAMGIDPARIWAAPPLAQEAHLARLQCCDLMLDPWPYGGHTSTADALFAGVPVIALEGSNFASRVNGSLLHAAGLGVLVQPDLDRYLTTAVALLHNPAELARLKAYIRSTVPASDVFNAERKARQMEEAYRHAYRLRAAGKAPAPIRFGSKRPTPAGQAA